MERLKSIKEQLIASVQGQMGNLDKVCTKELGEVIDMIKDLSKTIYYCSIVEAMEEAKEKSEGEAKNNYYYTEKYLPMVYPDYFRDVDYKTGRMYYTDDSMPHHYEEMYPISWKDEKEGKSGKYRKMYMESKQTQQDQPKKIMDLENYMRELTSDIMEMIQDASPEEKAVLQKKMNTLINKISNV